MLDRLSGMDVFARAARIGSISGAARQLAMSPSMATKHLDALEARLGVRLLQRSTRKLSLTEAGRLYLETVRRILPELQTVEGMIASQRLDASGQLRLNAPLSFGVRHIAPLLPAFLQAYPDVTVELGLNDRIVDLVDEGWDLTIRIGALKDSRLVARRLADSAMVVCAAPAYIQRMGTLTKVSELSQHNCLGSTISSAAGSGAWLFGHERETVVPVAGTLRANNGDALLAAASAGLGVLYEPEFIVADAIRLGQLEALALDVANADLGGIHLVYARDHALPAKTRAMMDFLLSTFQPVPPWHRR